MRIAQDLLDAIVDHARRDAPNECCGIIATTRDGVAVAVHAVTNTEASPLRFNVDPQELYNTYTGIEDAGYEVGGIYHSHTRSEPYPSQTDVRFAGDWPGVEWLIVGLKDGVEVRSYRIDGGAIREVPVERG